MRTQERQVSLCRCPEVVHVFAGFARSFGKFDGDGAREFVFSHQVQCCLGAVGMVVELLDIAVFIAQLGVGVGDFGTKEVKPLL